MLCLSLQLSAQTNSFIKLQPASCSDAPIPCEGTLYFNQETQSLQQWDGEKWLRVGADIMTQTQFNALTVKLQSLTPAEQLQYEGMQIYDQGSQTMQQWDGSKWLLTQGIITVSDIVEIPAQSLVECMIVYNKSTQELLSYTSFGQWEVISSASSFDNLGNHIATENIKIDPTLPGLWLTPSLGATLGGIYVANQENLPVQLKDGTLTTYNARGFVGIGQGFDAQAPQAPLEIKIQDQTLVDNKAFILRDDVSNLGLEALMVKLNTYAGSPISQQAAVTIGTENGAFQFETAGQKRFQIVQDKFAQDVNSVAARMGLGLGSTLPQGVMHVRASELQTTTGTLVPLVRLDGLTASTTETMKILQPTLASEFFSFNRVLAVSQTTQLQKVYAFETQTAAEALPVKHFEIYRDAQLQSCVGVGLLGATTPLAALHVRNITETTPLVQLEGSVATEYMRILQPTSAEKYYAFTRNLSSTALFTQRVFAFETTREEGNKLKHFEIVRQGNTQARVGINMAANIPHPQAAMHVRSAQAATPILKLEGTTSDKELKIQQSTTVADQFEITVPQQKLCLESSESLKFKIAEETQPRMQLTEQAISTDGQAALDTKVIKIQEGDILLEDVDAGVIMTAPNGSKFRLTVQNNGTILTTPVQ